MSTDNLSPVAIAQFLVDNPEFFHQHAEIFAELRVPHPDATRAISLGERQILTLRARVKDLEWRLAGLVHNASGNEKIRATLNDWCLRMLAEDDATRLPALTVDSLRTLFDLPAVALRLWHDGADPESPYTTAVDDPARAYAASLQAPYCGPLQDQPVTGWLDAAPASLAIVPLSHEGGSPFGLLVLASDDAQRFTPDMGTAFLSLLGALAGAALSRLCAHAKTATQASSSPPSP